MSRDVLAKIIPERLPMVNRKIFSNYSNLILINNRGSVPPGARFDPIGPFGPVGQPRGGFGRGNRTR
jgi:hypothetical protein